MAQGKVNHDKVILIGGSAGSLEVLLQLLPGIRADFPYPVVIVLHRKSSNDILTELLATKTKLNVHEIEEKEPLKYGAVYVAPGDYHVLFEKDKTFSLDYSEKINFSRPSIDVAFESAADAFGPSLICILLSGANADGTAGFKHAKEQGSMIIAQQPESAEVAYMPQQAILNNDVDHIFDVPQMIAFLNKL
jgi:two-component system chemotaxis response regulator CheB